jgi:hypothetical protein
MIVAALLFTLTEGEAWPQGGHATALGGQSRDELRVDVQEPNTDKPMVLS